MRPNAYSCGPSTWPIASSSTKRTFAPQTGGLSARTRTVSWAATDWTATVATTTAWILVLKQRIPPPSLGPSFPSHLQQRRRGLAIEFVQHREEPGMFAKRVEHRVHARVDKPAAPLIDGLLDPVQRRVPLAEPETERAESHRRHVACPGLLLQLAANRLG